MMMKKTMLVLLGILLFCLPCVAGAAETAEAAGEPQAEIRSVTGGWMKPENCAVDEKVRDVFDKAMETAAPADYEPVAYLGYQVVAGTNHCYLCRATNVLASEAAVYELIYIYEDLQGNAGVLYSSELNVSDFIEY